jgi:hypothetical protein
VSTDNGKLWQEAALGPDLGRFAFRAWSFRFTPPSPGKHTIIARASNMIGQTQADRLIFNPAGYHNNVPLLAMKLALLVLAPVFGGASETIADEQPVPLKNSPGREVVENNCAASTTRGQIPFSTTRDGRLKWTR